MSNVRDVIELLCKVLYNNGTTKIKAELFRLAKFDKDEAAAPMWKLLFELLYFLDHGIIDEVVIKAYNQLSTEEQVVYTKQGMQDNGFFSKDFSRLPNDMSAGSRELLLALAWLLGTQNVTDKFMESCASPLSNDFPDESSQELSLEVQEAVDRKAEKFNVSLERRDTQAEERLSPVQKVQQLQHLNGKLHMSLKRLYSLQRERGKLQHKLLKLLEKDNIRLQNLLLWKEQENVFWKWMESVLDLKTQDKKEVNQAYMKYYNVPSNLLDSLTTERSRLEASIMKYETIIDQIEEIWETKLSDVSQSELDRLLKVIDVELAFHKASIGVDKSNTVKSKYQEPQFTWAKPVHKKATNIQRVGISVSNDGGFGESLDVEDEIQQMETLIERLELQAKQKENHYRQELDRLAGDIPESVCIQPTLLR